MFALCVAAVIFLPRSVGRYVLLGMVAISVGALAWRGVRYGWRQARQLLALNRTYRAQTIAAEIEAPSLRLALVENAAVIVIALTMTAHFWVPDSTTQLDGHEAQWLTSTAYVMAYGIQDYGYIPLWHPFNGKGEPLIDNPFAFPLNPFSIGPTLLTLNPQQGIKTSVAVYAVMAACGGWFLGWALGLGTPGRLLLAAMMLGKGNMVAMIGRGYYQLGVQQAYIPWIIGAALIVIRRPHARWAVGLLALGVMLQFWAGNIWYLLPTLLSVGVLVFCWRYERLTDLLPVLRRFALAGAFTVGLSAATLLPVFAKRAFIGGHRPLPDGGQTMDILLVLRQFIDPSLTPYFARVAGAAFQPEFYYSFVAPLWFVLLVFVLLPPLYPLLGRGSTPHARRLMWIGLALFAVFTLWGIGGLQPFRWLYNNMPGIGRWRFVGRALGAASFWLAVVIALRVDGLWTALSNRDEQPYALPRGVSYALAVVVIVAMSAASHRVATTWTRWDGVTAFDTFFSECTDWVREAFPDHDRMTVYQLGYTHVAAFYQNRIRVFPIEADYFPIPTEYGLDGNLIVTSYPAFAVPLANNDRQFATVDEAYITLEDSPRLLPSTPPCALQKQDALPYAFRVPFGATIAGGDAVPRRAVSADLVAYRPDRMTISAQSIPEDQSLIVVSEVAYPGWHARVNEEPYDITPVGGYLGVMLPQGAPPQQYTVTFFYRPVAFVVGAGVTLVMCVLVGLYLLRVDQRLYSAFATRATQDNA